MNAPTRDATCRCARGACTPASSRAGAGLPPAPPGSAECGALGSVLLGILDPADELVAGQGRDVLPGIECHAVGDQRLTQVRGQLMHHPTGHSLAAHRPIVVSRRQARFTIRLWDGLPPLGPPGGIRFRGQRAFRRRAALTRYAPKGGASARRSAGHSGARAEGGPSAPRRFHPARERRGELGVRARERPAS